MRARAIPSGECSTKTVCGSRLDTGHEILDREHFDDSLELAPLREPEPNRIHDAEQSVASNRELEELGILGAAARPELAARIDQGERLDVADERRQRQPAPVNVGGQRSAQGKSVGAGLLL
ncbi:MAG: hypothetical protein GY769_21835, partial [bacterium]|nr:hypothetical protein [bacterium]